MLIITNRHPVAGNSSGGAFSSKFTVNSPRLAVADANKVGPGDGAGDWKVGNIVDSASDADIAARLAEHFAAARLHGRRILVNVHGNGYDYLECLTRCHALSSAFVGIEVIGFSWPSEGFAPTKPGEIEDIDRDMVDGQGANKPAVFRNWIKSKKDRFQQATRNAASSAVALTRTLQLIDAALATPGAGMSATLAVHSLGNQLYLHAVDERGADAVSKRFANIMLLAPCVDARQQKKLLDPLAPKKRVYVTFSKNDWVLAGAQVIDGDIKTGLDPGSGKALSANAKVRYVDFAGAARGIANHRYFIDPNDLAVKATRQLFERTFTGEDDLRAGEEERDVYPFQCDSKRKVCFMGKADTEPMPGGD